MPKPTQPRKKSNQQVEMLYSDRSQFIVEKQIASLLPYLATKHLNFNNKYSNVTDSQLDIKIQK